MGVIFQSGEVDGILKTIQDARTIIEQRVSDMRILAQAVLEAHYATMCGICGGYGCDYCGEPGECDCEACTLAREVLK